MLTKGRLAIGVICIIICQSSTANISFKEFSERECASVDWRLMYAIALQESGKYKQTSGSISANAYTFNSPDGSRYLESYDEAVVYFNDLVKRYRPWEIDVGPWQLNLKWNKHRIDDLSELLKPSVNLRIACEVVLEAVNSTDDIELGIGRYHSWDATEVKSRSYGEKVIKKWKAITSYYENE